MQVFHTELTKGQLNDETFMDTISLATHLWAFFNRTACLQLAALIDNNEEVSMEWIHFNVDAARVSQFIDSCLNLHDAAPECILHKGGDNTYHFIARSSL